MASFNPELQGQTPPVLPPKPGSHETSRIATPNSVAFQQPPDAERPGGSRLPGTVMAAPVDIPDPGDQWLPQILQDKPKQDLAEILASPKLLNAITHAPDSIHPSIQASAQALSASLRENIELAQQLADAEARLAHQRATTQAQLLSTHALERQWRQKQSDMDHALAPFSPAALYQQLAQSLQEQALVCQAMEESFLDGEGEGAPATEREATDWVRRYREAKLQYYLREERKERWDEGRVGGWR
ncbi:hypothetical protein QQX98_005407 [Neonectria punicea]|uniref:VPS37 C-terminal domain-containing protein n=1 Tax=Neonectria punicea TaxID=979145 RepID=A0ABR1H4P7_9HYPO